MSDPTQIALETYDSATDATRVRMRGRTAHKDVYFDVPYVSEIAENLWQGGCQNGLVLPGFIAHIVSLYPWERYSVAHELQSAMTVRMYDSLDQSFEQVDAIAGWVNAARKSGPVLVHCQRGLNRSSLVAARALILDGMNPSVAIAQIRERRSPACLCNSEFEKWLLQG